MPSAKPAPMINASSNAGGHAAPATSSNRPTVRIACTRVRRSDAPAARMIACMHERREREAHQRSELTFGDRVARDRVDRVRDGRRDTRAATNRASGRREPVCAERAERQRAGDNERAGQVAVAEEHRAQQRHQAEGRRGRRIGAHHGVAPRRGERRPERPGARPILQAPHLSNAIEHQEARAERDEHRQHDRGDDRQRSEPRARFGNGRARAVRNLREPVTGVEAMREERADARAAAHHQVADVAVFDAPHALGRRSVPCGCRCPARTRRTNRPATRGRGPVDG